MSRADVASGAIALRCDFPEHISNVTISDMPSAVMHSGPALRLQRDALGLSAAAVAHVIGVSEQRIRQLEGQLRVQPSTASRYITAIEQAQREREQRATTAARERVARAAAALTA